MKRFNTNPIVEKAYCKTRGQKNYKLEGKNLAWKVGSGVQVWKSPDALNVREDTCFSSGFPGKKKRGGIEGKLAKKMTKDVKQLVEQNL